MAQLETSRSNRDKELQTFGPTNRPTKEQFALAADERKVADRIRQKEREKQNAQKQLQRLVAEEARRNAGTKRTAAEERVRVELSNNFEQNEGKFPYPVSDGVIIDRFGKHPHPTQRGLTIDNKGVNIAGEKGAPVRCIFEGTVSRVVFIKGLNNCVMVNHGNYYTVYSNLESVSVKANDAVGRNQVIATSPRPRTTTTGTCISNCGRVRRSSIRKSGCRDNGGSGCGVSQRAGPERKQARTRTTADNTAEKIMAVFRNGL